MDWHDSGTAGAELPVVLLDRMASTLLLNIVENCWAMKLSGGGRYIWNQEVRNSLPQFFHIPVSFTYSTRTDGRTDSQSVAITTVDIVSNADAL